MKFFNFLIAKPAQFFLLAAFIWGGLMCYFNYQDGANFSWHDILVEANGMFFDLLVFGIVLSIYEAFREKKELITRLQEEIDDCCGWNENEASFRIVAAIKRLNKLGISKIKLAKSYLDNTELISANLEGAMLFLATLKGSKLSHANLKGAIIYNTNFEGAILFNARLEGARITDSNLKGAKLGSLNVDELMEKENIKRIDSEKNDDPSFILPGTNFKNAILQNNDLEGAVVGLDWFEKIKAWNVIGREEIMEKYLIDGKGILQIKTKNKAKSGQNEQR